MDWPCHYCICCCTVKIESTCFCLAGYPPITDPQRHRPVQAVESLCASTLLLRTDKIDCDFTTALSRGTVRCLDDTTARLPRYVEHKHKHSIVQQTLACSVSPAPMFCLFLLVSALLLTLTAGQYTKLVAEGFRVDVVDGGGFTVGEGYQHSGYPHRINCNPTQQFTDLPASGAVLQGFWSAYDSFASTASGSIRVGLYSVSGGNYTLLASTNSSSDLYTTQTFYGVQGTYALSIIRSNGPLFYTNASETSLRLDPTTSYALCYHSTVSEVAGQHTYVLRWKPVAGGETLSDSYTASAAGTMPFAMSETSAGDELYQMWITVEVPSSTAPVTATQPAGVSLGWRVAPFNSPILPGVIFPLSELRCSPTFRAPFTAPLDSFSTVYSPALTMEDGGFIRIALYTVSSDDQYTLVATTDASSDLAAPQGVDPGPVIITSVGPLSSYTVVPNIDYAICLYNNDGSNIIGQYGFVSTASLPTLSSYTLGQPMPVNPQWTDTTPYAILAWINVLAINQTSYFDTRCGGGVYDLSDLTASDLSYNQGYYTWVLRVCGAVSSLQCANSSDGYETAMLCQVTPTSVYAASYNEPTRSLWNITDTGLALTMQDGGYCGPSQGYVRETVVNFVCDPLTNGTSSITAVVEQPTCVYTVTVATDAVCSGSNYVPGASSPSSPSSSSSSSSPVSASGSTATASSSTATTTSSPSSSLYLSPSSLSPSSSSLLSSSTSQPLLTSTSSSATAISSSSSSFLLTSVQSPTSARAIGPTASTLTNGVAVTSLNTRTVTATCSFLLAYVLYVLA